MLYIPNSIKNKIETKSFEPDNVGMSGSNILLFPDQVLKIRDDMTEADNEVQAMQWLKGRIQAPEVLARECEMEKSYLLMTRVKGRMACDEHYMKDPERLTGLLARALKELWLVDMDNVEPDTFGADGFESPEALLLWLWENKPQEEPVLSHGDFCLPNIFIDDEENFSFIDLGRTGIADKWQDIALCYRSLKHNYDGKYGGKAYRGYDPELLFEMLGIEPEWEKLRYYILLDELF